MNPKELEALTSRGFGYNHKEVGPLLEKIRKSGIIRGGGQPRSDYSDYDDDDKADSPDRTIRSSVVEPDPLVKDVEVTCIDNTGIEQQFDENVEYVAERGEDGFLRVYDTFVKKQTCIASRFKMDEEE